MTNWSIQLKAAGFNNWMEFMGQSSTAVKEQLVILESGEKQLSDIWESGAMEQWERGFFHELGQVKDSVAGMWEVLTATREAAEKLARMEKDMTLKARTL